MTLIGSIILFMDTLPNHVWRVIANKLEPLWRRCWALTCRRAYALFGPSPGEYFDFFKALPYKHWQYFRDDDPVRYYYERLLFRAARQTPLWLLASCTDITSKKKIYRDKRRMVLGIYIYPAEASFKYELSSRKGWKMRNADFQVIARADTFDTLCNQWLH
jgi:hypothetical protein